MNLAILVLIFACVGFYCLLESQEVRIVLYCSWKMNCVEIISFPQSTVIHSSSYVFLFLSLQERTVMGMANAQSSASFLIGKPHLIYGTAWKKEETASYVAQAVKAGFRFIDTACQPMHYNEPGVGNGWTAAATELGLKRSDLWLQTKYTAIGGQDPNNVPYDPKAPIADQIRTSLETSLKNLHTTYLDSWVMHLPFNTIEETIAAWRVMEEAVDEGKVRQLGMSNCYSFDDFQALYQQARIKPKVLQNRFYADSNFDTELRQFCEEHGIHYQSFWTLSASRHALASKEVHELAKAHDLTPQTYMFAFLMSLGYITPLLGTTSRLHMAEDVAVMERMQGGEVFFHNEEELRTFAQVLGMPDL
jgi:diketogulonate reductase-like aldo/keto reductase